jgi:predicted RNA-binding protein YlqC (UPF0109 family)
VSVLGEGSAGVAPDDESGDEWDDHGQPDGGRAKAVLLFLVRQLVDEPDAIKVDTSETRNGIRLSLRVAPDDMGKVIGRRGRVAQSIRAVVRAAGAKDGVDVAVDIVD